MRRAVLVLLLVLTACGRSRPAAAARVPDDPCALLSAQEASTIVGVPLHESPTAPRAKQRPVQYCFYLGTPAVLPTSGEIHPPNLGLRVVTGSGVTKVVAAERAHPPPGVSVEPLTGIGDEAILVAGGMVVAAVRGVRIEVSVVDESGPSRDKAITAAHEVATRITG